MPRSLADIQDAQRVNRSRIARLIDEKRELEVRLDHARQTHSSDMPGLEERLANVERGLDRGSQQESELAQEWREEVHRRLEDGSLGTESEQDAIDSQRAHGSPQLPAAREVNPHVRADHDRALRTIERCQTGDVMSSRAAVAMERLIRSEDPLALGSRYLTAVGDPAYNSAFGKMLQYGDTASMRMTPEELTAVQRVTAVVAERAMAAGTGSTGGFALPIAIDPTILLTSSGALNPIRQVADVREISSYTLRLVTADTPSATYAAELTEVADSSPTLVQPTIQTQRGQAFIPFSIEIDQDWTAVQRELAKLLSDARDILDATKFLSGTGTNEPVGLFAASGGLTNTQRIQTATTATTAIDDLYALKAALASTRFWVNATFAAHPTVWDTFFRFVGGGNTTEPQPFTQGRGGPFLGTPKIEWSTMATATATTGTNIAVAGDWSGYVIADRIGASVELVPHLFGPTNHYPIGARGLYFFWRCGTVVAKPNAFRFLQVK